MKRRLTESVSIILFLFTVQICVYWDNDKSVVFLIDITLPLIPILS